MRQAFKRSFVPSLDREGKLVIAAATVRAFDYGFLSVFLGVYLSLLDFSAFQAGLVFSGIMAGGALSNVVATWKGDSIGRRRYLVFMATLLVVGGVLFPFTTSVAILMLIGLIAMTTTTGGDRTAFLSLDMAILAQQSEGAERTVVFSWYNLIGFFTRAGGSLMIAVPSLLQPWFGLSELNSFKVMFWVYSVIGLAGIALYAMLSPAAESSARTAGDTVESSKLPSPIILRLSALFSLDALGGGFMVRSFMSYFFVTKFGVDLNSVAFIFFGSQLLNVLSVMAAAPVASRIGLIATMASSQIVSSPFIAGMALTTNLWIAVLFLMAREITNEMDIPTRQSYTMAIVPPESRTSAAGATNLGRNIAQTISPTIAGYVAQATFLGAPFLVGSGIKLIYNALLYLTFAGIKPPQESDEQPMPTPEGDVSDEPDQG